MIPGDRSSAETTGVAPLWTSATPAPSRARAVRRLGRLRHTERLSALSHAPREGRAGGRPRRGPPATRRRSRRPRSRPSPYGRGAPRRDHRDRPPQPRLPDAQRSSASAAPPPREAQAGSLRNHCARSASFRAETTSRRGWNAASFLQRSALGCGAAVWERRHRRSGCSYRLARVPVQRRAESDEEREQRKCRDPPHVRWRSTRATSSAKPGVARFVVFTQPRSLGRRDAGMPWRLAGGRRDGRG